MADPGRLHVGMDRDLLTAHLFDRYATDIYVGQMVTVLLVAGAYLLTLIVEWPFVAACFRGTEHWFKTSVKGSLLVQFASYMLLFGVFLPLSDTSLYSKTSVVPPERITAPRGVPMFYISLQTEMFTARSSAAQPM